MHVQAKLLPSIVQCSIHPSFESSIESSHFGAEVTLIGSKILHLNDSSTYSFNSTTPLRTAVSLELQSSLPA